MATYKFHCTVYETKEEYEKARHAYWTGTKPIKTTKSVKRAERQGTRTERGQYASYTECECCGKKKVGVDSNNSITITAEYDYTYEDINSGLGFVPMLCATCAKKLSGKSLEEVLAAF